MVTFACPSCRRKLQVEDRFAGQKSRCPCGQVLLVPAAGPPPPQGAPVPDDPDIRALLAPPQGAGEVGRLGPYRVLRELGRGGMGVVFLGEDPALGRPVALKAMLPSQAATSATARQRFLREAKAAASLRHDHVITVYHVGEDRGWPFLAMEYLEGETLEDRLQREGRLPVAEALRVGREAAAGLAAAHARGLVHRDVKPANLWLEAGTGRVKLLDFGLTRVLDDNTRLTQSGVVVGTPAYMAPEQARGEPVDGRCDLFSLGCVLYRACTGELPFRGEDTMATLIALATAQPMPACLVNLEVPAAVSDYLEALLAKKPDQRPASARQVADALAALERPPAEPAAAPGPPAPARAAGCRRQAAALVALALALAARVVVWAAD